MFYSQSLPSYPTESKCSLYLSSIFVTHLLQYLITIGLYNLSRYPRTRLRYLITIGYGPRSRLNQSIDKRNIRPYFISPTTTSGSATNLNNLNYLTLQTTDTTVPKPHHTTLERTLPYYTTTLAYYTTTSNAINILRTPTTNWNNVRNDAFANNPLRRTKIQRR
jgi:hypothetical protein